MAATASLNKSPHMKEWMAQVDPPKEANMVKKMNGRSLLISSNKTTHYFKEWTTASYVLKKIYYLYKNLMLQRDILSIRRSQKLPRMKIKAIHTPKEQSRCCKSHPCKCKCLCM